MSVQLRVDSENSQHVHVSVFAGPEPDHRAHCGQLTFRHADWAEFRGQMELSLSGPAAWVEAVALIRSLASLLDHTGAETALVARAWADEHHPPPEAYKAALKSRRDVD